MFLVQETIFTSSKLAVIDADCKKDDVIVLLKGKGENSVQLNGKTIYIGSTGHHKIRFTKEHFCLLHSTTLSFYTLAGNFVSEWDIGNDVFEMYPYRQGVLCSYGDEGVFSKRNGKNRLNYASPFHQPESFYETALQNDLLYEPLFARYKPQACLSWETNELIFLNEQLVREKTIKVPFDISNVLSFALTYNFGVFIEENKVMLWDFETSGGVSEYPEEFSCRTRGIFHRHEFLFITVLDHEVRVIKPIMT